MLHGSSYAHTSSGGGRNIQGQLRPGQDTFQRYEGLAKGGDGRCVFLDDATRSCKIYGRRPLECRIYPFLLDFDSGVGFKLDMSVCTHLDSLNYDGKAISGLLEAQNWPEDWIKAYLSMDG